MLQPYISTLMQAIPYAFHSSALILITRAMMTLPKLFVTIELPSKFPLNTYKKKKIKPSHYKQSGIVFYLKNSDCKFFLQNQVGSVVCYCCWCCCYCLCCYSSCCCCCLFIVVVLYCQALLRQTGIDAYIGTREDDLREGFPVPHDNFLEIY